VHELVGHEAGHPLARRFVAEDVFGGAVVARLVMLQPEVRDLIAQRHQPVVVAIVRRAEKRDGLLDQPRVLLLEAGGRLEREGVLRSQVDGVAQAGAVGDVDLPELRAHLYRRVDQRGQRHGLEGDVAAAAAGLQRRGVLPAGGEAEAGRELNGVARRTGGVEHQRVPTHHRQTRRRRRTGGEDGAAGEAEEVEVDFQRGGVGRHVDVKGEHLQFVAPPLDRRAVRGDLEARQPHQRSARRVLAGDPLRVQELHRSRRRGDGEVGAEDIRRRTGGVDAEGNRCRIRDDGGNEDE
jgi:hypothetical protein